MIKHILKINIFIILMMDLSSPSSMAQYGTWTIIDTTDHIGAGNTYHWSYSFCAIKCADSLNYCAIGNMSDNYPWNRVTTDGGNTWFTTLSDTALLDSNRSFTYNPPQAFDIAYPDTNLCIVVCDSGYIWQSTDRCRTWKKTNIGTNLGINNINFYNKMIGGLITYHALYLTNNGGQNWEKIEIPLPDTTHIYYYYTLSFPDSNKIILSSCYVPNPFYNGYQYIFISQDFGKSWNYYYVDSLTIEHFYFMNDKIGWATGFSVFNSFGPQLKDEILHTTDGGMTWKSQLDTLLPSENGLNQIYFSDSLNGIAIGPWFKMWRTSDGGEHWLRDTSYNYKSVKIFFNDIKFFSPNHIIGVTDEFWIYKLEQTDGVNSWQTKDNRNFDVSIYPNPATNKINVKFFIGNPSLATITIHNSRGEIVEDSYSSFLGAGYNEMSFTIYTKLPDGAYFLRIVINGVGSETKPFLILN